jgi:hypothetical protein
VLLAVVEEPGLVGRPGGDRLASAAPRQSRGDSRSDDPRDDDQAGRLPGGHDGFLGGEYGQMGRPDAFAAKLRGVLAATS